MGWTNTKMLRKMTNYTFLQRISIEYCYIRGSFFLKRTFENNQNKEQHV